MSSGRFQLTNKENTLVHNYQWVIPVLTYGAKMWTLTHVLIHIFKVAQRAIGRAMSRVFLSYRIRNDEFSRRTKVTDISRIKPGRFILVRTFSYVWNNPFLINAKYIFSVRRQIASLDRVDGTEALIKDPVCNIQRCKFIKRRSSKSYEIFSLRS